MNVYDSWYEWAIFCPESEVRPNLGESRGTN